MTLNAVCRRPLTPEAGESPLHTTLPALQGEDEKPEPRGQLVASLLKFYVPKNVTPSGGHDNASKESDRANQEP
jgi:hypothetical protein